MDDGEDPAAAAAREVEEETGWRPRGTEFVLSCQPVIGNADYPQDLYLARGADRVGEPEADEATEVRWVPVDDTPGMIASGDILGAMAVIGVQHVLLQRQAFGYLCREIPDSRGVCLGPESAHQVTDVPDTAGRAEADSQVQGLTPHDACLLWFTLFAWAMASRERLKARPRT